MATHILWLHGIKKQEKRDFLNFKMFKFGKWLPQNFSDLFKSEKNRLDYRVHGIQIDRLNIMVSPSYHQKTVQNRHSKPNQ